MVLVLFLRSFNYSSQGLCEDRGRRQTIWGDENQRRFLKEEDFEVRLCRSLVGREIKIRVLLERKKKHTKTRARTRRAVRRTFRRAAGSAVDLGRLNAE